MNRRLLLPVLGAVVGVLLFGGLVTLLRKPPPIACWLELRYAAEPESESARSKTADVIQARLKAAGFRGTVVRADGDGLLVRLPLREPRGRGAPPAQDAAKAREDHLAQETDLARKLIETPCNLAFHKVDACGAPEGASGAMAYPGYACDSERWRKALAGEPTPGFRLAELTTVRLDGAHRRTEKLLLVAEPMADGSMVTRALATLAEDGLSWNVLVYLNAVGTARVASGTSAANMQHKRDRLAILLDGEVKSAPVVESQLSGVFQIAGRFTREETEHLANILNAGTLPCKVRLKSQRRLPPESAE
jgi:preprotein translocase subunit SecD